MREGTEKNIFEQIMAKIFPKLMKIINSKTKQKKSPLRFQQLAKIYLLKMKECKENLSKNPLPAYLYIKNNV